MGFGVARALAEKIRIEAESVLPFVYLTNKIHFTCSSSSSFFIYIIYTHNKTRKDFQIRNKDTHTHNNNNNKTATTIFGT